MANDASALADILKNGLGFTDPTTSQLSSLAQDIVDHIGTSIVNNIAGTVTGDAPPSGGSLINGAALGGIITLVPADLVARFSATFGTSTPEIAGFATAVSSHILTALVKFDTGNITGVCSNTLVNPGVLAGQGAGGIIEGLVGSTLALLISSSIGQSGTTSKLSGFSDSLVTELLNSTEATYLTGSVLGVISAGGGPIALGAGSAGTLS